MSQKNRTSLAWIFSLILALTLSVGCTRSSQNQVPPFVILRSTDSYTLDPRLATTAEDLRVTRLLYANLVERDPKTGEFRPGLASWQESPKTSTIVLTIKDSAQFGDGRPISAETVKVSLDRWLQKGLGGDQTVAQMFRETFGDITVESPKNLRMALRTSVFRALSLLSSAYLGITGPPPSDPARLGDGNSSGLYHLIRWDRATRLIELEKRGNEIAGWPKRLILKAVDNDQLRRAQLERGEAQAMDRMPLEWAGKIKDDRLKVVSAPGQNLLCLVLNTKKPPFDRIEARRAFAREVNAKGFVETILSGYARSPQRLVPESLAVLPPLSAESLNPSLGKASKPSLGVPLKIVGPAFSPFDALSLEAQIAAKKLGYKADLSLTSDIPTLVRMWSNGEHHIAVYRYLAEVPDPGYFVQQMVIPGGSANLAFFTSPSIDGARQLYQRAKDTKQALESLAKLEREIISAAIIVPVAHMDELWLIRTDVKGFMPLPSTFFTFATSRP